MNIISTQKAKSTMLYALFVDTPRRSTLRRVSVSGISTPRRSTPRR